MRAICVLTLADVLPAVEGDYIGVDRGALILARQGIHMKCAIGDFDSVEPSDLSLIQSDTDEFIQLNPIKDDSDSEAAITYALQKGYDEIWFVGATGGRMDHAFVNLKIAEKYPGCVKLFDQQNLIYCLPVGTYTIQKNQYPYISFFTTTKATISLQGFKYPLHERTITYQDCYTLSNEILKQTGTLTITKGIVLVMQCKDLH